MRNIPIKNEEIKMKCPDCDTEIVISNPWNEVRNYCLKCKKYWDTSYLEGYFKGYVKGFDDCNELIKLGC